MKTFAAIVIGSTETEMRVYEIGQRKGMKQIDRVSARLSLGEDAYAEGKLDREKVDELCRLLIEFKVKMDGYGVDDYEMCATSALREIRSSIITKDYIEKQTGLRMRIISNSEQRFLDYKSIASEEESFENIIKSGTAIVDIGGNSMQISVFDKDRLITTQNIRLGKVNTRERYYFEAKNISHFEKMLDELLDHELAGFGKLYQKDRQIKNLIVVDSDLSDVVRRLDSMKENRISGPDLMKVNSSVFRIRREEFERIYEKLIRLKSDEIAGLCQVTADTSVLVQQSLIFCSKLLDTMEADTMWLMDASICDGLCYDYGIRNKMIRSSHNFDDDIIAASRTIAKRYKCSQPHLKNMEELTLEIFDKLRKIHGLGKRERLLLQIAAILHNCGKYISLTNISDCAFNIIMATEIIGLSHAERLMIANIVRYNTAPFVYYQTGDEMTLEEYLVVAKLTAILRLGNALDQSYKQRFEGAQISLSDDELKITIRTNEDLTLERLALQDKAGFFEEVFNVRPVIAQKKKM